jgi:hypothetical protein
MKVHPEMLMKTKSEASGWPANQGATLRLSRRPATINRATKRNTARTCPLRSAVIKCILSAGQNVH